MKYIVESVYDDAFLVPVYDKLLKQWFHAYTTWDRRKAKRFTRKAARGMASSYDGIVREATKRKKCQERKQK